MLDLNELFINILLEILCIRILIFSFNLINYILSAIFSSNYIYMFEIDAGVALVLCLYVVMIIICLIEACVSNCDADENHIINLKIIFVIIFRVSDMVFLILLDDKNFDHVIAQSYLLYIYNQTRPEHALYQIVSF